MQSNLAFNNDLLTNHSSPQPDIADITYDPSVFCPDHPGEWSVLHTKSRQEKALSQDLTALRIPHFLPLHRQARYYGNRKSIIQTPLFASYLFIKAEKPQVYLADRTRRVANIIRCPDQQKIHSELHNINQALLKDAPFAMYPALVKGIRVEVRSGPFRGLQGVIEDRQKNNRLLLQVETLGQALALEVDGSLLDVLN